MKPVFTAAAWPGGRTHRGRLLALLALPALGVSLLSATPSPAITTADPDPTATPATPDFASLPDDAEPVAVTLITGDTVYWQDAGDGNPRVADIEEASRDFPVTFDQSGTQEDFYVIPSDVMDQVVSGALDGELFNIPNLIRQGLDDESTGGELPVIVTFDDDADEQQLEDNANALPAVSQAQGIEGVQGAGVKVDRSRAARFRETVLDKTTKQGRGPSTQSDSLDGAVDKILLDEMLEIDLSESVPQIGAPEAWDAGFTGEGVTVAVLDTGIDTTHPDLAGQVVNEKGFVTHPLTGLFAVEHLNHPVRYMTMTGPPGETVLVPRQGSADPLVYVGRACVDSEGDELLADPAGKTALIVRGVCNFSEKYDAAVEAGATAVVVHNTDPDILDGNIVGAEHVGEVWAARIGHIDGAALRGLLDAGEEVVLGFTDEPPAADDHGHGTHVASTIAGTGAASDGARRGVAPDAELLSGKVCDFRGQCPTSATMAAMEWATEQGADMVNMSLGGGPTDGTDPLSQLVNQLSAQTDTLFVISAGNSGEFGLRTVGSPGAATAALTVGAVDKSNQMADFSSRGPRRGDHAVKPEITAPGVGIIAARATGSSLAPPVDDVYMPLDGTSMAAPHVAGAAALLTQAEPDLEGEALKDALVSTAADGGHRWFEQGTGRVDVPAALDSPVYAQGTLNFGGVDGQAERDLVYTNHSEQDITLSLDAAVTDTTGSDTDAAGVSLSTDTLTVPANGQASVTVTVTLDPDVSVQGPFGGAVTATGSGVALRTAIGFGQFLPTVTIEVLDSNGDRIGSDTAPDRQVALVHDSADPDVDDCCTTPRFRTNEGIATGQVKRGIYTLMTKVEERDPDTGEWLSANILVELEVVIGANTSITLDARDAVRLEQPDVPREVDKRAASVSLVRVHPNPEEKGRSWVAYTDAYFFPVVRVTPTRPADLGSGSIGLLASWTLAEPQPLQLLPWIPPRDCGWPTRKFYCYSETPAYIYNLAFLYENGIPDNLHEMVTHRDLVEVPNRYHHENPDALMNSTTMIAASSILAQTQPVDSRIFFEPGEVTEYFSANDGISWERYRGQRDPDDPDSILTQRGFDRFPAAEAGTRRTEERWFEAPMRPGAADGREEYLHDVSVGDYYVGMSRGGAGPRRHEFLLPANWTDNTRGHIVTGSVILDGRMWNLDTGTELERERDSFPLAPSEATYRLELTGTPAAFSGDLLHTAPATTTVWTFTSRPSDAAVPDGYDCYGTLSIFKLLWWQTICQIQPLIQLEYDLGLDIQNRAPAGRAHLFTINAGHHSKAIDRAKVTDLSVEASFDDGDTWTDARVIGKPKDTWDTGGFLPSAEPYQQFRVVLNVPPLHRTSGLVSLRVQAEDANGGTVEQTIKRAYILEAPDIRGQGQGPNHRD